MHAATSACRLAVCLALWSLVSGADQTTTSPSNVDTTSSTYHTAPAPASTVMDTVVIVQKEGDCKGYCGVAFCKCGKAVGCPGGVFGCGTQAGNPSEECFCDESCLKDSSCCGNYNQVCVDGGDAAVITTTTTTTAVAKVSDACDLKCLGETCGFWLSSVGLPLSQLGDMCSCSKCNTLLGLQTTTTKPLS